MASAHLPGPEGFIATIGFNTRSIEEERTVREAVDFAVGNAVAFFGKAADRAEDYGVALALENLFTRPGDVARTYQERMLGDLAR